LELYQNKFKHLIQTSKFKFAFRGLFADKKYFPVLKIVQFR
jgi:hypothetical protein